MSRRTELEEFVINEAVALEGVPTEVRMGRDPGRERMKKLNSALEELDGLLKGQQTIDRRLAYSLYALAYHVDMEVHSWIREGKEWPAEFMNEELPQLLLHVEYILEGGLCEVE